MQQKLETHYMITKADLLQLKLDLYKEINHNNHFLHNELKYEIRATRKDILQELMSIFKEMSTIITVICMGIGFLTLFISIIH